MALKISAEEVIRALAGGFGMGLAGLGGAGAAPATSVLSAVTGGGKGGQGGKNYTNPDDAAGRMQAAEYPNPQHTVQVEYLPGPPQLNAKRQDAIADKASRMQTLEEHNAALTKFIRPNQTPQQRALAIQQGVEEEENLLSYWYDKGPRKNYTPSSSAIRAIRVTPDHRVQVQWGTSPKWYSYLPAGNAQKASEMMRELMMSRSLGQSLCRKSRKPGCGDWARKYFDASFGT